MQKKKIEEWKKWAGSVSLTSEPWRMSPKILLSEVLIERFRRKTLQGPTFVRWGDAPANDCIQQKSFSSISICVYVDLMYFDFSWTRQNFMVAITN